MSRKPNSGKKPNLSQFGLLDIPDINEDDEQLDLSDDDFDLEAELAAITGGGQKPKPRKPAPVPPSNLDAMIAESLKDVPSDDEGSGDDDDPDFLNELQALSIDDDEAPPPPPRTTRPAPPPPGAPLSTDSSTISLLQDRITNYTVAEKNAKSNGESSRARRFSRGLKTLQDLLKQAKAGKPITIEDIPPPVMVGKPADGSPKPAEPQPEAPQPPPPVEVPPPPEEPLIDFGPPEPSPPQPSVPEPSPAATTPEAVNNEERQRELQIILDRRSEFKAAALAAKKRGDKFMALGYLKITKQFDLVVEAHNSGQVMNLEELPTLEIITNALEQDKANQDHVQDAAAPAEEPSAGVLITAKTLGEGLQQRLEAFQKLEAKAQEEGNTSKARRMNRITKQYTDAIKQHEKGKPIPIDELPTPAGYGPLLTTGDAATSTTSSLQPAPAQKPASTAQQSRREAILAFLIKRQTQFKEAALYHKKKGETDTAIQLLRNAKRFDPLIEATKAGKPVDLNNLPSPPQPIKGDQFTSESIQKESPGDTKTHDSPWLDSVHSDDVGVSDDWVTIGTSAGISGGEDLFSCLLTQLESQAKMTMEYMTHCRKIGHVAESKMFEKLNERVREDLDILRVAMLNNRGLPNFHYVMREFSISQCNTDLGVNDLELTIVRGIAYHMPKDLDSYVKFEFPFPQEAPISERTDVVKDTNNPEYNAVFPLAINRSRACLRVFKRHSIKFEVWNKGGWFRSDTLVGTVVVKLAPLQTEVTLHDSFPLLDGRRPAGGSLEVKLRVRTPLVEPEVKSSKHRWLILDDVDVFTN